MKVKFADLRINNKNDLIEYRKIFDKFLNSGKFIDGNQIKKFENIMSKFIGTKYCVGLSSGSSALYLALKSLNIGIGDEVITTPFSWIITTNAIVLTGAKPVFADIGNDLNIDPNMISKLINKKTKAIVPMHTAGHMCQMDLIKKIASENKLFIVEDAAQAICSKLNNRHAGSFSTVAAFSLNPMKLLGGFGECGFITTNSKQIYDKVKKLRHAGVSPKSSQISFNNSFYPSLNHKMDTMQASFLIHKFKKINKIYKIRDKFAKIYDRELSSVIELQGYLENEVHGRYLYIIKCKNREKLHNYLKKNGVETKIYYQPLCPDVDYFKEKNKKLNINKSRKLSKTFIAIPLHENLKETQINFVISKIKKFYK